ncbi:hypothetical protein JKP88DRAFT_347507 [Tribonema minus]|uniref:Uncharacterized protein n=1 Tax=Tribonema minus TaxID=303371 RepID=A0A835ZDH7_9STRA|nr:hypothetical protein JKP88DRAFT_347507 [Tribonema minus]
MGKEALLTQAANRRLGLTLYRAGRLAEAEAAVRAAVGAGDGAAQLAEYVGAVLLVARAQLFQGKLAAAAATCADAVRACEDGVSGATPDTAALGNALRSLGVVQLLRGDGDAAETSLLRAARLSDGAADQAKARIARQGPAVARVLVVCALSSLAAYSMSIETAEGHRDALEYWQEAVSVLTAADAQAAASACAKTKRELQETHAITLTNLAEAALTGAPGPYETAGAGGKADTERPSAHLREALKLSEQSMGHNDPYLGWVLAQLARCCHLAGSAVTAEGLFRSAMEKMDPEDVRGKQALAMHPSPANIFLLQGTLSMYSQLLLQWEKREAVGRKMQQRAQDLEAGLPLKLPPRVSLPMLHLCR